jgi:hypothetical protein
VESLLQDVADLTKTTLSEPCEVSATLLVGNRVHNAAHTGELARDLDAVQLSTGSGPTLDANLHWPVGACADMASEARWVGFRAGGHLLWGGEHGFGADLGPMLTRRYPLR